VTPTPYTTTSNMYIERGASLINEFLRAETDVTDTYGVLKTINEELTMAYVTSLWRIMRGEEPRWPVLTKEHIRRLRKLQSEGLFHYSVEVP